MIPPLILSSDSLTAVVKLLLTSSLKATLLVIIAYGLATLWKRGSAASRYWLLSATLIGLLALPILPLVAPAWPISIPIGTAQIDYSTPQFSPTYPPSKPVIPSSKNPINTSKGSLASDKTGISKTSADGTTAKPADPNTAKSTPTSADSPKISWQAALVGIWALGMFLTMLRWLRQWLIVRRMVKNAYPIDDPAWLGLLNTLTDRLGVRGTIGLAVSEQISVPLIWGVRRPVIVLPISAANWPVARRRVVLLHELSHATRQDALVQLLIVVSCAFNWFNPLVWLIARRVSLERERASDDAVLNTGIKQTEYAAHLLAIAQTAHRQKCEHAIGLAMARRSDLTPRIHSILATSNRTAAGARRWLLLGTIGLLSASLASVDFSRTSAQTASPSSSIVLTLSLPSNLKDVFNDSMLKDFEAANPGVTIEVRDTVNVPAAAALGRDAHFAALEQYADSADVLYIGDYDAPQLSPLATRAGYFLDLTPLINADPSFNSSDFFPTVWQSFQWDNGIWAMPTDARVDLMAYDPAAFDKANVPYPTDSWTAQDFFKVVQALTLKNPDGKIPMTGFGFGGDFERQVMLRALIGADVVDASAIPNPPAFTDQRVQDVLSAWTQAEQQQQVIGGSPKPGAMMLYQAEEFAFDNSKLQAAFLPGGQAYVHAIGFGISGGTQHPDLAYALVKFLTTRAEFSAFSTDIPARLSLAGSPIVKLPPNIQALIKRSLTNALTIANMRFTDYLRTADNDVLNHSMTAVDALNKAQNQAQTDDDDAAKQKGQLVLSIKEPEPPPSSPGKIALTFDVASDFGGGKLPNPDQWDKLTSDFTARDPQVAQVKLAVSQHTVTQAAAHADCFYLRGNAIPSLDEQTVLPIEPFLSADPTFNKADYPTPIIASAMRDNHVWTLPLTISPTVFLYDPARFKAAGVPTPDGGWTLPQFLDAVKQIQPTSSTPPVTVDEGLSLLALMADFGGVPLDYRTDPPTIDFTSNASTDAIQQVLDLARSGSLSYHALGNLFGGSQLNDQAAMIVADLSYAIALKNVPPQMRGPLPNAQYVLFPTGNNLNGLIYDMGGAYISASTPYPDACYRFIRALSQHPELFPDVPAQTSLLKSWTKAAGTTDLASVYVQLENLLNDPRTVAFSGHTAEGALSVVLPQHWLFQAFDSYVLNNGDLVSALQDAQQKAKGYLGCIANMPPLDLSDVSPTNVAPLKPYVACAEKVDPSLTTQLAPFMG